MPKRCRVCHEDKPLSEYYVYSAKTGARRGNCKSCEKQRVKKWGAENPEKPKAYNKTWLSRNRDRFNSVAAEWGRKTGYKRWAKFQRRLSSHGLTLDSYHAMVERQNFCCAVCGEVPDATGTRSSYDGFVIDHDHSSGRVRGLLCSNCNCAAGLLKDSEVISARMSEYLLKHNRLSAIKLAA